MNKPKYHHYVSAGYLRMFAKKSGSKDLVHCVNIHTKEAGPESVRDVAGEDYFFLLDDHSDPYALENDYATQVENPGIRALRHVCELRDFSNIVERKAVLLLLSLFAARNPRDRKDLEENVQPLNKVLTISALGQEGSKSLEAAAALEMNTTKHSLLELKVISDIYQCLFDRKWVFLQASDESGGFITSDYPVTLIAHSSRTEDECGLGFALKDVAVFIPLSRNIAILGNYDGKEEIKILDRRTVAVFNREVILNAPKEVYSYSNEFEFLGSQGTILTGVDLPRVLQALTQT